MIEFAPIRAGEVNNARNLLTASYVSSVQHNGNNRSTSICGNGGILDVPKSMTGFRVERPPSRVGDAGDRSGDRGRRVVCTAASGAKPGDLVLSAPPFAALLDPPLWATHCHRCFRTTEDLPAQSKALSRCGRCRVAYYCSRTCQQQDWKPDHHVECPRLQQLTSLRLRDDQISNVLLLARVVRRLLSANTAATTTHCEETISPLELVWNESDCTQETELLAVLTQKLGLVGDQVSTVQDLQRVLSRFQNNNFTICDARLLPVGAGCFPLGAMVNHSCSPNAVITFEASTHTMQFRAIQKISPNEELTHAYVDVALPRTERQQRLQHRYHFSCACERCSSPMDAAESTNVDRFLDADVHGIDEKLWPQETHDQVNRSMALVDDAANGPDVPQRLAQLTTARDLQDAVLHQLSTRRLATLSQLFTLQLQDPSSLQDAATTGDAIRSVYERVYPRNHPMLGLHLFTLGDLCAALDQNELATTHLGEALRILRITHGDSHPFVGLLQQRLAQLHQ